MVEARDLTMQYGSVKAIEGVSFYVKSGEIMGLLGPNGAGKTTVMRILSTQVVPVSGEAFVNGASIRREPEKVRASLGYLPENPPLYDFMETAEYLEFVASARGLSGRKKAERISWVVEVCGLEEVWRKPVGELSKGYRQRVGLAQALIHDPPVLILDEPTTGLDPLQVVEMRRLIKELSKEKAVIFSTHILQEVEALANTVTIINNGRVVASGTKDELSRKAFSKPVYEITAKKPLEVLKGVRGISVIEFSERDGLYFARVEVEEESVELFDTLCREGLGVVSLERVSATLEEIFLRLVKEERDAEGGS